MEPWMIVAILVVGIGFWWVSRRSKGDDAASRETIPGVERSSNPVVRSIVQQLVSASDSRFEGGLNEIKRLTNGGHVSGIIAAREAIAILAERAVFTPYKPGPIVAAADEFDTRDALIGLARKRALFDDPHESQRLLSAFKFLTDQQDFSQLVAEAIQVGGTSQGKAILLLNLEMWCFVQLTRMHGKDV